MGPIITRTFLFIAVASIFISSCSSQSKFASSFGKRRYTKGYYTDVAGKLPIHKGVKHSTIKPPTCVAAQNRGNAGLRLIESITPIVHNPAGFAISKPAIIRAAKPKSIPSIYPIINAIIGTGGERHTLDSKPPGHENYPGIAWLLFLLNFLLFIIITIIISLYNYAIYNYLNLLYIFPLISIIISLFYCYKAIKEGHLVGPILCIILDLIFGIVSVSSFISAFFP